MKGLIIEENEIYTIIKIPKIEKHTLNQLRQKLIDYIYVCKKNFFKGRCRNIEAVV